MINHNPNVQLRPAVTDELSAIWEIISYAIEKRRQEGSSQWQDGYPNPTVIQNDIDQHWAFVLLVDGKMVAYAALIKNFEPAYDEIVGQWLSSKEYYVVHRLAVSPDFVGKGWGKRMMKELESWVVKQMIFSIKLDTNFDNLSMLAILKDLQYKYCGKVYFRGSERLAFEKLLLSS